MNAHGHGIDKWLIKQCLHFCRCTTLHGADNFSLKYFCAV